MKKGIIIDAFGTDDLDKVIPLAKKYGYEGIQVVVSDNGPVRYDSTKDELLAFKKKLDDADIKIAAMVSDKVWAYNILSDDAKERDAAKQVIIKELEVASILGVDAILVVPGMVYNVCHPDRPIVPYNVAYDRAIDAFTELAKYAEKYNVAIGIENVGNRFLVSPLEVRDFLDKIGSPKVKCFFDVANIIGTGYPEHWIRILGDRIVKVHFKDVHYEGIWAPKKETFLLDGVVNYPEVMKALKEIGYATEESFVIPEVFPNTCTPEELLERTSSALDEILKM